MRSSNSFHLSVLLGLLALSQFTSNCRAQDVPPATGLDQLRTSTSLDREGMHPWHLRISFQIFTLQGKPQETGTVEEWWTSPAVHSTVITSPSISAGSHPSTRESILVDTLLNQLVHPVPAYKGVKGIKLDNNNRTFSKVKLSCLTVSRDSGSSRAVGNTDRDLFCRLPGTDDLRVVGESNYFTAIRNRAARFLNTQLTMDAALSYNDIPAIRGHVETLETFDPAKALQLAPDSNKADGVVPGAMLNQAFPTLAPVDKARHIGGTVLVHSMITTQGTVGAVIVVASPDPALTAAVVTAAKKTTYTPFLLNGQPIEAEMTDTFTLIDNN